MAEDTIIRLFTRPRKIESELVQSIVDVCIANGSLYDEDSVFHLMKDFNSYKGSFKEAIKKISSSKYGGTIYFTNKNVGFYSVGIWLVEGLFSSNLGNIQIRAYGGNFEKEDTGPENAKQLIKIAKSVWNSLDEKPIYGYADDTYSLPAENDPHPTDNDILAIHVPINKFWLNFYGKAMIEKFGRGKLKERAYKLEELDDGILVITDTVPKQYKTWWGKTEEEKKEFVKGFMDGVEEYLKKAKK